jgi:hypothetical protein
MSHALSWQHSERVRRQRSGLAENAPTGGSATNLVAEASQLLTKNSEFFAEISKRGTNRLFGHHSEQYQ